MDEIERKLRYEVLLAEVKRLREKVKRLREELRLTKEWLHQLHDEELNSAFRHHVYGDDVEVIE